MFGGRDGLHWRRSRLVSRGIFFEEGRMYSIEQPAMAPTQFFYEHSQHKFVILTEHFHETNKIQGV